jgi:hypothetical protein
MNKRTKKGSHKRPSPRPKTHPTTIPEKSMAPLAADTTTATELLALRRGNDTTDEAIDEQAMNPEWFGAGHRDPRDPHGHIKSRMLAERTRLYELHPPGPQGQPGLFQHDLFLEYERQHPEFAAEYEAEKARHPEPMR